MGEEDEDHPLLVNIVLVKKASGLIPSLLDTNFQVYRGFHDIHSELTDNNTLGSAHTRTSSKKVSGSLNCLDAVRQRELQEEAWEWGGSSEKVVQVADASKDTDDASLFGMLQILLFF